jgi:hypothetical protein
MPRVPSNSNGSSLFSHIGQVPITVGFALVVLAALLALALLRHLFASVSVAAGTK